MKAIQDVCRDEVLDRLEKNVNEPPSRPDARRRWAMKVIERVRLTDLAIKILLADHPELKSAWARSVERAMVSIYRKGDQG